MVEIILSTVYINIMLKENQRGLLKFFTSQKVLFLGFFLILCFILYSYSSSKNGNTMSGFATGYGDSATQIGMLSPPPSKPVQNHASVKPTSQPIMDSINQPIMSSAPATGGYNSGNTVVPADLLPKDNNTQFGDFNMLNQGNIVMPDLLDAGYLIGLDTIGQSFYLLQYVYPELKNNSINKPFLFLDPLQINLLIMQCRLFSRYISIFFC